MLWHSRNFNIFVIVCFCIELKFGEGNYYIIDGEPVEVKSMRVESLFGYAPAKNLISNGSELIQNDAMIQNGKLRDRMRKPRRECVRCPTGEIEAVARAGYDGILVEPPAPLSCKTNLPFSNSLFRIETLFGAELNFVLPEGRHKFIGKIRNVENGRLVRSCHLKYNVVVRRCKHYPRHDNQKLKMSCSAGTIWGSKCAFECKEAEAHLTHYEPMVCNDDLEWDGQPPYCHTSTDFCARPPPLKNGEYICEEHSSELFASGSVCRVQCKRTYTIPLALQSISTIQCEIGEWKSTVINFCYNEGPKRRSVSRRHPSRRASNQNIHPYQ